MMKVKLKEIFFSFLGVLLTKRTLRSIVIGLQTECLTWLVSEFFLL